MFTNYFKSTEEKGESCDKRNFRTRNSLICYHCGKLIPADRNAVKLRMTGGKNRVYLQHQQEERCEIRYLHIECARKSCK